MKKDDKLFAEFINSLHFELEKAEDGYKLYDTELGSYRVEDDNYLLTSADAVIEELDTFICDSLNVDLQEELDNYPNVRDKYENQLGVLSCEFTTEDWFNVGKSMAKSENKDEQDFYKNHEWEFDMCYLVAEGYDNVNLDNAYEIQKEELEEWKKAEISIDTIRDYVSDKTLLNKLCQTLGEDRTNEIIRSVCNDYIQENLIPPDTEPKFSTLQSLAGDEQLFDAIYNSKLKPNEKQNFQKVILQNYKITEMSLEEFFKTNPLKAAVEEEKKNTENKTKNSKSQESIER